MSEDMSKPGNCSDGLEDNPDNEFHLLYDMSNKRIIIASLDRSESNLANTA